MNAKVIYSTAVAALVTVTSVVAQHHAVPIQSSTFAIPQQVAVQTDIVDTAVGSSKFQTLVAAVKAAGLVDTLKGKGPFTLFAPSDEAFKKLPEGTVESLLKPENLPKLKQILTYHVVPGKVMANDVVNVTHAQTVQGSKIGISIKQNNIFLDKAKLMESDIICTNGVIHVVDNVLIPTSNMSTETIAKEDAMAKKDIVDTAVAAGQFNTLVTAVKAAGLVGTLKSKGPFTVFAPTDQAFAKLPEGTIETLLKPESKDQLTAILTYHVVPGKVLAQDVVKIKTAKTVNGSEVQVQVTDDGAVMIDGATVIKTDIECGNGVIHVIDSVITPK